MTAVESDGVGKPNRKLASADLKGTPQGRKVEVDPWENEGLTYKAGVILTEEYLHLDGVPAYSSSNLA